MRFAQGSFWCVTVIVAIVGLGMFASHAGGPERAVSAPVSAAATEIKTYLRVDGIEGECTGDLHKGCMEVLAYETIHIWGDPHMTEGSTGNDLGTQSLTVTRNVNKATPVLASYCCQQTRIPTVTLEVWREGGPTAQKLMVYTHHECALNAIRNMKGLADEGPIEELTFTAAAAEWSYTEYDASGKSKGEVRSSCDGLSRK
jgi:type VI secretion system secreted protein Hcp